MTVTSETRSPLAVRSLAPLATRLDQQRIVLMGAAVAVAYQAVMSTTTSIWQVAAAQVLNAVVISAVTGVGISYFQAPAPDRPGFTTTLFSNTLTVGTMLSGPLLGLAQQLGYRTAYPMSVTMSVLGVILLIAGMTARRQRVRSGGQTTQRQSGATR